MGTEAMHLRDHLSGAKPMAEEKGAGLSEAGRSLAAPCDKIDAGFTFMQGCRPFGQLPKRARTSLNWDYSSFLRAVRCTSAPELRSLPCPSFTSLILGFSFKPRQVYSETSTPTRITLRPHHTSSEIADACLFGLCMSLHGT